VVVADEPPGKYRENKRLFAMTPEDLVTGKFREQGKKETATLIVKISCPLLFIFWIGLFKAEGFPG